MLKIRVPSRSLGKKSFKLNFAGGYLFLAYFTEFFFESFCCIKAQHFLLFFKNCGWDLRPLNDFCHFSKRINYYFKISILACNRDENNCNKKSVNCKKVKKKVNFMRYNSMQTIVHVKSVYEQFFKVLTSKHAKFQAKIHYIMCKSIRRHKCRNYV